MSKIERLPYDKFASTFGWRIKVKAEYDYRVDKTMPLVIEGYSKAMQVPEMKNKAQLLLDNVSMLFDKRWIYKSDGILIYKAVDGILFQPLSSNKHIIYFRKDGEQVIGRCANGWNDDYCVAMIEKMIDNYNKGYQRGVGLRIA